MDAQISHEVNARSYNEMSSDSMNTQNAADSGMRLHPALSDSDERIPITLPDSPTMEAQSIEQAYQDSFQAVLAANIGYYVVIEFLIGTSNLTEKEGLLYAVGNNFVTLYEAETNRYIVCDLFSIKFVTIYNQRTRPRSRMNNSLNRAANSPTSSGNYGRRLF
ncbi:MAG: hypothetical protein E7418_01370 [Ruminococcaceae bacterium]|nr:hypothetical protein [Oscillospiraceae bacterium]